jgi:hypothetical protein
VAEDCDCGLSLAGDEGIRRDFLGGMRVESGVS